LPRKAHHAVALSEQVAADEAQRKASTLHVRGATCDSGAVFMA
jgi:hypothetical protein